MKEWLETLPYVLPCKFCRASLADYYKDEAPKMDDLPRWLYRIHNRVNAKLRGQGQQLPKDPTFREVREHYAWAIAPQPRQCESFPGWDFLFSVAYNHPLSVKGKPMPDVPAEAYKGDDATKNRWNILEPRRRLKYWQRFWTLLPAVFPPTWRAAWAKEAPAFKNRRETVAWLWRTRCAFSHGADPYRVVCSRLAAHESGCGRSTRARTCRRVRVANRIKTRRK